MEKYHIYYDWNLKGKTFGFLFVLFRFSLSFIRYFFKIRLYNSMKINICHLWGYKRYDEYWNERFGGGREDGIYPVIRDAYRSNDEQKKIMKNKMKSYKNEGYPEFLARRSAKDWMAENAHQYGFILRYPKDKE